jgi:hypothetical protein
VTNELFNTQNEKEQVIHMQRDYSQWSKAEWQLKWGGIFAGLSVGIAVQIVFTMLGLAIGAWSIDFRHSQPASGIPLATGLWAAVSMLISAFIGGYVASRSSGASIRTAGLYHGAVVWGVTSIVFTWLATTALSFMIGGLFAAFGTGLQMLNQGVGTAVSAASVFRPGKGELTGADLRRQIESVLQATDKPELQPGTISKDLDSLTAQAKDGQPLGKLTDSAIAEIQAKLAVMDRGAAVSLMVNKLGLSEPQAQRVADSAIEMVSSIKAAGTGVKEKSIDLGNATMTGIGSAAWWLFILAVLSLGASLAGGALGTGRMIVQHVQTEPYREDVKRAANT